MLLNKKHSGGCWHFNEKNYDAETNTSDFEKNQDCPKQNFEDDANNMQLDKEDT